MRESFCPELAKFGLDLLQSGSLPYRKYCCGRGGKGVALVPGSMPDQGLPHLFKMGPIQTTPSYFSRRGGIMCAEP